MGPLLSDCAADSPGAEQLCTGTLIDDRVFLTAAHCTAFLESSEIEKVWVTFAPRWDEDRASTAGSLAGRYVNHPEFGTAGKSDPHDIAVVLLEQDAGVTPGQLPTAGRIRPPAAAAPVTATPVNLNSSVVSTATCWCRSPSTGDAMCRAPDKTHCLDNSAARDPSTSS